MTEKGLLDDCRNLRATPATFLDLRHFDAVVADNIAGWLVGYCQWERVIDKIKMTSEAFIHDCLKEHSELVPVLALTQPSDEMLARRSEEALCGLIVYQRIFLKNLSVKGLYKPGVIPGLATEAQLIQHLQEHTNG